MTGAHPVSDAIENPASNAAVPDMSRPLLCDKIDSVKGEHRNIHAQKVKLLEELSQGHFLDRVEV
jgi:hypothetical protein